MRAGATQEAVRIAISAKDGYGRVPIHFAARSSDSAEVVVLLVRSGPWQAKNGHGRTPLAVAKVNGRPEEIRALLSRRRQPARVGDERLSADDLRRFFSPRGASGQRRSVRDIRSKNRSLRWAHEEHYDGGHGRREPYAHDQNSRGPRPAMPIPHCCGAETATER